MANVHAAVSGEWADRYCEVLTGSGLSPRFHADGDALAAALAADWDDDRCVILDLAFASPRLASALDPFGPRLLAFGDPDAAGLALGANLIDFLPDRPTEAELATAVDAALTTSRLASVGELSDRSAARLGAIGADMARVADALARLEALATSAPVPPINGARVRAAIEARRARDRFFPTAIFGEPAWDMLLDLTLAAVEQRDVAVSSLCIAAAVPTTTALRWIKTMIDLRLFQRRNDPGDARRAFISLSEPALSAMARYLVQAVQPW